MKKLILSLIVIALSLPGLADSPPEWASREMGPEELTSYINRMFQDLYQRTGESKQEEVEIQEDIETILRKVEINETNIINRTNRWMGVDSPAGQIGRYGNVVLGGFGSYTDKLSVLGNGYFTGNIGIGSVSPSYPLTIIAGSPQISIDDGTGFAYRQSAGADTSTEFSGWETLTDEATGVSYSGYKLRGSGFMYKDGLYIAGGYAYTARYSEVYYSADGYSFEEVGNLPKELSPASSIVFDNKLVTIGGNWKSGANFYNTDEIYYSSDGTSWSTANFPINLKYAASAVHNSELYVCPGNNATSGTNRRSSVYKSNNLTDWTLIAPSTSTPWSNRNGHSLVSDGTYLYVMGGSTAAAQNLNDVWRSADGISWTEITQTNPFTERELFKAVYLDGKFWVNNGLNSGGNIFYSEDAANWTDTGTGGFGYYSTTDDGEFIYGFHSDEVKAYTLSTGTLYTDPYFSIAYGNLDPTFKLDHNNSIVYINDKLSLKLGETGRYFQDADYEIQVSTHFHVPTLEIDGQITNIEGALTDQTVIADDIKDHTITEVKLKEDFDGRTYGLWASSTTYAQNASTTTYAENAGMLGGFPPEDYSKVGLFEVRIDGDLQPVTDNYTDNFWALNENDDIAPKGL